MNDHGTEAGARRSRREFLRIGTGVAGAVSLASILAACGASSAQPAADSAAAGEEKEDYGENAMRATIWQKSNK